MSSDVTGSGNGLRTLVLVPVVSQPRRLDKTGAPLPPSASDHAPPDRLDESIGLAQAISLNVVQGVLVPLPNLRPSTLFGSGKVDELKLLIETGEIELVIVDHTVSPVQQHNLEKAWDAKVLDRTGLILEIFGERARTREGRLQVELAHLTYQKGRLVRSWTHLERQRGGAGFLGGPGERQIELDRRMIQDRIDAIHKELAVVVKTRELHRTGRRRVPYPVIALVGYTNAGKSTLFNHLTGAEVYAEDQVFATLDPTMREVKLASGRRLILSDTVGFISDLPTMLIAAFRATLEEVIEADIILHVRDIAHGHSAAQRLDVCQVLTALGIDPAAADSNIIEVWNKIDLLTPEALEELVNAAGRDERHPALVSAISGEGIDGLLRTIDSRLGLKEDVVQLVVPAGDGALINWLHENSEILSRQTSEDGTISYNLRIAKEKAGRLAARLKSAKAGQGDEG